MSSPKLPKEVLDKLEDIKSNRNSSAAVFTSIVAMEYEDGSWFVDDTTSTQDVNSVIKDFVKDNSVKITSISAPSVTVITSTATTFVYSLSVSILYAKMPIDTKTISIPTGQQRQTIEAFMGKKDG